MTSATELNVVSGGRTEAPSRRGPQGYDLLRLLPIRTLVHWSGFPYVFQAALLAFFVFMAVFAWGLYPPEGVGDKLFAKTHLINLLVWGLWWPAMVWAAVLFGRVWCAVCPLELVTNGTERLAQSLGVRQHVLGKWLRAGWLILALYALIQLLIAGVHLHRIPAYTSVFLWGLLGTAALVGFFFKDRGFCRGFCPVGLLLGTYGRGSMLAVRRTSDDKCNTCTGKDCVRACNRTRLDARSCPSLLNPARLDNNADCLVCGQCVKSCGSENMGIFLRRPFHAGDAREPLPSWPVTLFVMLVSGFVIYELFSEWKAAQTLFLWVPTAVTDALAGKAFGGWIKGVWTLFVVPLVLWLVLGGLVLLFREARSMGDAWRRLALPLAVVIAVGHMCKSLAKIVSWGGFLPLAAKDPRGVDTARAITAETLAQPGVLMPITVVSVTGVVMLIVASGYALREFRLAQGETRRGYRAPVLVLASCFLFLVVGWGFLQ